MRRAAAALGALLLAGAAACAQQPVEQPVEQSVVAGGGQLLLDGGGVALLGADAPGPSPASQVRGTIVGGLACLLLEDDDDQLRVLVLPRGTTAVQGGGVRTPDGVVVRPGDGVTGAGAVVEASAAQLRRAWPQAPDPCWPTGAVAGVVGDLRLAPDVAAEQRARFATLQRFDDVDGGTVLVVPGAPPNGGADARVSGVLTRLEGGCLGLVLPDGSRSLVRWPHGTTWDPVAQALTAPGAGASETAPVTTRIGEEVALGGGQGVASWDEPALPQECPHDLVWVAS